MIKHTLNHLCAWISVRVLNFVHLKICLSLACCSSTLLLNQCLFLRNVSLLIAPYVFVCRYFCHMLHVGYMTWLIMSLITLRNMINSPSLFSTHFPSHFVFIDSYFSPLAKWYFNFFKKNLPFQLLFFVFVMKTIEMHSVFTLLMPVAQFVIWTSGG